MRRILSGLILLAIGQATCAQILTPVAYINPGAVYFQNFDGLPATGTYVLNGKGPFNLNGSPINGANLAGWQILMLSGTGAGASFAVSTGSSTGNAVYSLGAAGSTDRALGSLSSTGGIYAVGLILTNQTGGPLNSFTISFTAEQWRKGGSGNKNTWSFRYKTGIIPGIDQTDVTDDQNLNFSSPINTSSAASLNGNLPDNQQAISYTVHDISWKAGEQLLLRWDDADETGNDDAVGIDNFSFSASLASSSPTVNNTSVTAITSHSAMMNGSVNDHYSNTDVTAEYDTVNSFSTFQSIIPSPNNIPAGSGNTNITAALTGLISGKTYYARIKTLNSNGSMTGNTQTFTTLIDLPLVTTLAASAVTTGTALLGGNVLSAGGAAVSEKGIAWSLSNDPVITNNKIIAGNGTGNFTTLVTGLPQGTVVYAKAYAINAGGIAYGDPVRFVTQTIVTSFSAVSSKKTNANTVDFILKTAQAVSGLSIGNFSLAPGGINDASITNVAGTTSSFTVTVYTGTGDGTVQPVLINDMGLSLSVNNKPFTAVNFSVIDKTAPGITSVAMADKLMKIGDTVPVIISVKPDPDNDKIVTAKIDGFPLAGFSKKDDSTYYAYFIITSGGTDIGAAENIPVVISLRDSVGNVSGLYQNPIIQTMDAIDANKPSVVSTSNPPDKIYKLNDTLDFVIRFTERILVSLATPSLSLTVGAKTKNALYVSGSGTDNILFRYIVQPGDVDTDGIKLPGTITLNSGEIKDIIGNVAVAGINNIPSTKNILVDGTVAAISSVSVPVSGMYTANDTLNFTVSFPDKVFVTIKTDTPIIKLTIGSVARNMNYISGSGTGDLLFRYVIKKGDLDKNGISIGTAIGNGNSLINNLSGNPATLTLKNIGSLADLKIDAAGPVFVKETETVLPCENVNTFSMTNTTSITDDETGELIKWKIVSGTIHGNLVMPDTSIMTNGKIISVGVLNYIPFQNYDGLDSFVMEVSDGYNKMQKKIVLVIQPAIKNNLIDAISVACANTTLTISGSVPGGGDGNYQYVWETATAIDSGNFTKAANANTLQQYAVQLGNSAWFRRRIVSDGCADTSSAIKITTVKNGLWLGNTNNSWHNENNWCANIIPAGTTDVYVYAAHLFDPVITDTAKCNHLILGNNTHLKITGILQVSGNINTANAMIDAANGALVFNGSFPQTIPGNAFEDHMVKDLVINNYAGVSLNDSLTIARSLVLNNGFLLTNNHLNLQSVAVIGPSASGTSIIGTMHIEHFIKGGRRCFWLLGHPFTNAVGLKMISDSVDITGDGGSLNGFTTTATNQPSAFKYDPVAGNDSSGFDAGWIPFTNTNNVSGNAWERYSGIRLFVRGKPGQGLDGTPAGDGNNGTYLPQSVMLKLSGNVNHGDQEIALVKGIYAGYHIVSNPYVSDIDLSMITRGSDISMNYWTWNPQQGKAGGYTSFPFRSKNILNPFGAFIVKANGTANHHLIFTENSKSATAYSDSIAAVELDDIFYVELRLESDNVFWDRVIIFEMDSARSGYDRNDAEKMMNPGVNFYSIGSKEKMLSIDARPVTNETMIPLGLQANETGTFRIRVAKAKLPASNTLMLHDIYLNAWMTLEKDSSYSFNITSDTAVIGNSRFEIVSRKTVDPISYQSKIIMKVGPVPAKENIVLQFTSPREGNTSVRIVSLSGKPLKTISLGLQKDGQVTIPVGELISGIYLLELTCGNLISTQKMIKE